MIGEIIRRRRKELNITQEQVGMRLGVTAPAVNKWEKGVSYPDIELLSPLARLLKMDVNELLEYKAELTEQEITQLDQEIAVLITTDGFEEGLRRVKDKIQEYPGDIKLIHNLALLLDGMLIVNVATEEEKEKWQEEIFQLYQKIFDDREDINNHDEKGALQLKNSAAFMLASKYISKNRLEEAQEMIDFLPEHSAMDKRNLQANLYRKAGKNNQAECIYGRLLLADTTNVWNCMIVLLDMAIEKNDLVHAKEIAESCETVAKAMQLPEYYSIVPRMELAAARKDTELTMDCMEQLIQAVENPNLWQFEKKSFYQKILQKNENDKQVKEKENTSQAFFSIKAALVEQYRNDEKFAFLHRRKRYKDMMERLF